MINKSAQEKLIRDIMLRRIPDKIHLVDLWKKGNLSRGGKLVLCKVLNEEFLEFGIDEHFEPTKKGLEIEELIDQIN